MTGTGAILSTILRIGSHTTRRTIDEDYNKPHTAADLMESWTYWTSRPPVGGRANLISADSLAANARGTEALESERGGKSGLADTQKQGKKASRIQQQTTNTLANRRTEVLVGDLAQAGDQRQVVLQGGCGMETVQNAARRERTGT